MESSCLPARLPVSGAGGCSNYLHFTCARGKLTVEPVCLFDGVGAAKCSLDELVGWIREEQVEYGESSFRSITSISEMGDR